MTSKKAPTTEKIDNTVGSLAKILKAPTSAVWNIYVKRYVARGIGELVAAIAVALWCTDLYWAHDKVWLSIPYAIALLFVFDAIQLLTVPEYWAIDDAEQTFKRLTSKTNEVTIYNNR